MQNRRVVLLSNHSLLAASIQSLLQSEADFEFYTVATNEPKMSTEIKKKNPHAIIIDSGDALLGEDIITRLLVHHPRAMVIALNLNRREFNVYGVRRVLNSDLDGFMDTLRGRRQLPDRRVNQKKTESEDSGERGQTMGI